MRACEDCKRWLYDEDTGQRKEDARTGKPRERPEHAPVRCETKKGCPRGKPEDEMKGYNWLCYLHYLQCKATGQWPDDETVKANAGLIRAIEDDIQRSGQRRTFTAVENNNILLKAVLTNMLQR